MALPKSPESQASGFWPYQDEITSRGILALFFISSASGLLMLLGALVKGSNDLKVLLDALLPVLCVLTGIVDSMHRIVHSKKMLELLDRIEEDWTIWTGDQAVEILREYAQTAKRLSLLMIVFLPTATLAFLVQPMLSKIFDVLLANGTKPGKYPFPLAIYLIDEQEHYFPVMAYICLYSIFFLGSHLSSVTTFTIQVYHACGIFAAVGSKLERMGNDRISPEREKREFEALVTCIDRHNRAIAFAKLVDSTYSTFSFFIVACITLQLSIIAFQIGQAKAYGDMGRYLISITCELSVLFGIAHTGQILIHHSTSIRDYIHKGKWYKMSLKSRNLLTFMIMRCNMPCELTTGMIWTVSLDTYVMILKTVTSYVTLAQSLQ